MNYENTQLRANANEVEDTRSNLQMAYQDALTELDTFKGKYDNLDSLLNLNKTELEAQQIEIASLLAKQKLTTDELDKAKTLISNLKLRNRTQVNTLDSLYNISKALAETNLNLQQDLKTERNISDQLVDVAKELQNQNDTLEIKVDSLEIEKERIAEEAEKLAQEKEDLESDNKKLSEQVSKAAILKTANLSAFGVRFKNNGKEKSTKDYKKAEKIKICYDVLENPLVQTGLKELLFRITHPEGFTLSVAETGSGSFVSAQNVEMSYTTTGDIDYKNDEAQSFCTYWAYDSELSPGIYNVQIFHLGYQVGQTSFELKSTFF